MTPAIVVGLSVSSSGEDMNPSFGVDGHGPSVSVAPTGSNFPNCQAGAVSGDDFFSALAYGGAMVVFPGAAVVVAVSVAEIVAGFGIRIIPPAPGQVQAVIMKDEAKGVGVDGAVATGPILVNDLAFELGVDGPFSILIREQMGVRGAGATTQSHVTEEMFPIGMERGVGHGGKAWAAEVVLNRTKEFGIPGIGFGVVGNWLEAGAIPQSGKVMVEG